MFLELCALDNTTKCKHLQNVLDKRFFVWLFEILFDAALFVTCLSASRSLFALLGTFLCECENFSYYCSSICN